MKIRTGFVSNSSSSSFLIYGVAITMDEIKNSIASLYNCASDNPEFEFLIAYTGEGKKLLNGYTLHDMAFCFADFSHIPENIVFEENFARLVDLATFFLATIFS